KIKGAAAGGRCRNVSSVAEPLRHPARSRAGTGHGADTLVSIREEARRERLLDMEHRVRPYRAACFVILFVALALGGSTHQWWWAIPLTIGFAGFAIADRFMASSARPA